MRGMEHRRAAVIGMVVLVMATTGCSTPHAARTAQPTGQPSASARVSASTTEFVSKRYRFRLALDHGWSGSDAEAVWDGKNLQGVSSPSFADFTDPTGRAFTVGAATIRKGTRLAAWRAAMLRGVRPGCTDAPSAKSTTLGGEPALEWTTDCGDGSHITKIAAVHGTRGYMTIFELSPSAVTAEDQRILESIRGSFQFTE